MPPEEPEGPGPDRNPRSPNTLKTHLRAIYRKLGCESREEAVIRARKGGLI
jgi:DNA-binding CsgD family transcriptional regulator